jgi:hypothetical protein
LSDPSRTPLESVRALGNERAKHLEICELAAEHALTIISELADQPSRFESLWHDEAVAFDAAAGGIGDWIEIEEVPEHDLAIVKVAPDRSLGESAGWGEHLVHPAAVNSATDMMRIATVAGKRMELRYRYETWVRMETWRPRPRVDLSGLAAALTGLEPAGVRWSFDGAGAIRPVLKVVGDAPSGVPADQFLEEVKKSFADLDSGRSAWDPYV